jgi:hypothetical protein
MLWSARAISLLAICGTESARSAGRFPRKTGRCNGMSTGSQLAQELTSWKSPPYGDFVPLAGVSTCSNMRRLHSGTLF